MDQKQQRKPSRWAAVQAAWARLLAAQAAWRAAQCDESGEVKTMTRGFDWQ